VVVFDDIDRYAQTRTAPVPAVSNPSELIDLAALAELRNIPARHRNAILERLALLTDRLEADWIALRPGVQKHDADVMAGE
jgi:hypothetical protein